MNTTERMQAYTAYTKFLDAESGNLSEGTECVREDEAQPMAAPKAILVTGLNPLP